MNLDGSGYIQITNDQYDNQTPVISPDNSKIAYASMRDGKWQIFVITSGNGLIAFTSNRDGNYEIYVMDDCAGCAERRLTQNPANDLTPAISPDGGTIAFSSNRDGSWRIYTIPVNNPSNVQPLSPSLPTAAHAGVSRIDWHPNGDWLIFMVYEGYYWSVWRINADGSGLARLIDGSSLDAMVPRFTKDGSQIILSKT